MLCTKITLSDFGYLDVMDGLTKEWDELRNEWGRVHFEVMSPFLEEWKDADSITVLPLI